MAQLDPYRADILMLLQQGQSQAAIMRTLKDRYNVVVKRSTISDYVKTLGEEEQIMGTNGAMPGMPMMSAHSEDALRAALTHGAGEEILERLAQLVEGVQQLKREGDERHTAVMEAFQALGVHDTLERHTRQFEALYGLLSGAALWKIWLRAALFTGAAWGVLLSGVYAWGTPAIAAKIRSIGLLIAAYF